MTPQDIAIRNVLRKHDIPVADDGSDFMEVMYISDFASEVRMLPDGSMNFRLYKLVEEVSLPKIIVPTTPKLVIVKP